MKMILSAAVAAIALTAGSAFAADLPSRKMAPVAPVSVAPAYKWSGAYVGVNAGYGFGSFSKPAASNYKDPDGYVIGGQLGFNQHYSNNLVLGLESDLSWSDVKGKASATGTAGSKAEVEYFMTARGRVGYAFDRVLPYVTAGYAGAEQKVTGNGSSWRNGYALGGGVEVGISKNVTAKIEGLYMDLGNKNTADGKLGTELTVLRAGVNYKF
jgi:outer membrane immunogenic protein